MKDIYNLTLTNQIKLNDKTQVKKVIIKLIGVEIILQLFYQAIPYLVKLGKSKNIRILILISLMLVFVGIAKHYIITTEVYTKTIKYQSKLKIVYFILLFLLIGPNFLTYNFLLKSSLMRIINLVLLALVAAICEELLFRGIFFNVFLLIFYKNKYILFWTSVISSTIFGLFHLINLFHQSLISTESQIVFALAFGLMFSYLRLISNNLIWCIILHFILDFSPQIAKSDLGNSNVNGVLFIYVPVIIFMLICIYRFNCKYIESNQISS